MLDSSPVTVQSQDGGQVTCVQPCKRDLGIQADDKLSVSSQWEIVAGRVSHILQYTKHRTAKWLKVVIVLLYSALAQPHLQFQYSVKFWTPWYKNIKNISMSKGWQKKKKKKGRERTGEHEEQLSSLGLFSAEQRS